MSETEKNIVTVEQLEIKVVASSEDPYGQGGFSSKTAKIQTKDKQIISVLKKAREERSKVVIRCSNLQVKGQVFKCEEGFRGFEAVVSADEIRLM